MNEDILIGKWSEPERIVSAYFWYRETLNISPDVETPQEINWIIGEIDLKLKYIYIDNQFVFIIASCLILSWVLVYLAMVKGITESPKVVYVSTILFVFVYFCCVPLILSGRLHHNLITSFISLSR